jgi:hypothetical protein
MHNQILSETDFLVSMGDVDWKAGKVSGTVYHGGEELTELVTQVRTLCRNKASRNSSQFGGKPFAVLASL